MEENHQISSLADEHMPPDISRDTRRLVEAISAIKALEYRLPLMDSIREVEEERSQTMVLAGWAERRQTAGGPEEWIALVKELAQWAARVSMMCQRRVGQLLKEHGRSKGAQKVECRSGRHSETPPPPTLAELGIKRDYAADAKVLASVPEKDLTEAIATQIAQEGEIKKKNLIKQIRYQARSKGEKIDEATAARRAKWRLQKEKERSEQARKEKPPPAADPKEETARKFRRYWTQEKRLLRVFNTQELEKIGQLWWQHFAAYRSDEEQILSDHRQESYRRKAAAVLAQGSGTAENS